MERRGGRWMTLVRPSNREGRTWQGSPGSGGKVVQPPNWRDTIKDESQPPFLAVTVCLIYGDVSPPFVGMCTLLGDV